MRRGGEGGGGGAVSEITYQEIRNKGNGWS